jgi:hypothetical protein
MRVGGSICRFFGHWMAPVLGVYQNTVSGRQASRYSETHDEGFVAIDTVHRDFYMCVHSYPRHRLKQVRSQQARRYVIHVQYVPVHPERKLVPQRSPLYLRMYHSAYRSRRWSVTICQTLEMKE